MRWTVVGAVSVGAAAIVGGWAAPASASSDATCYPRWTIVQGDYDGCSSTALMAPGNDSRVNLLMLLHDRHGAVGPTDLSSHDWLPRRGDARPFDYGLFANRLGGTPAPGGDGPATPAAAQGTRCQSDASGAAAFQAAIGAERRIGAREREALAAKRRNLSAWCLASDGPGASADGPDAVRSAKGLAYQRYLNGAAAFYAGDFTGAEAAFAGLGDAGGWLGEAARYMVARTALNAAMAGAFDEWGDVVKASPPDPSLGKAARALAAYLAAYPAGRYAASARGLMRRVHWLAGDRAALTQAYLWQFAQTDPARRSDSLADLVQEADVKLLRAIGPAQVRDPVLLAVLDLKAMRRPAGPDDGRAAPPPPVTRGAIEAQARQFAGHEALFAYLRAAHAFYVAQDAPEVLRLLPTTDRTPGYLGFSRRMLRALALDRTGEAGARDALAALIEDRTPFARAAAQLALAMHDERHGAVERVFAAGSPVRDPEVREQLLRYAAGPALLRQVASRGDDAREATTARFILLYKGLTRGRYAEFVRDLAAAPPSAPLAEDDYATPMFASTAIFGWAGSGDFACPGIGAVAATLARDPRSPRARLCLGEFVRLNALDPGYRGIPAMLDEPPPEDELGGVARGYDAPVFSRLAAYRAIIADARAPAEDRAYALHRAVRCWAPAGYNGCDATEAPLSRRRAWFTELKARYPASRWARELDYYW